MCMYYDATTKNMKTVTTARFKIELLSVFCLICLSLVSCVQSAEDEFSPLLSETETPVAFSTAIGSEKHSRASSPDGTAGAMNLTRLESTGFGVFAQYTAGTAWMSYTAKNTTPFNFMWNQQVDWDADHWTYSPLKYWPNDNTPADNQGATGSLTHSYLQFFAYAPYVQVADPTAGLGVKDLDDDSDGVPDYDGIVDVSVNSGNVADSYIHYRTSQDKPFGVDESIDLLWAAKRDCYKYGVDDADDYGRVDDLVPLLFKHTLTKLEINVRALIDRTSQYTSPGYSFTIDDNSRLFIDEVRVTTPPYYSEGRLMLAPDSDVPTWSYPSPAFDTYRLDGFHFDSNTANGVEDIAYALRWNGTPADRSDAADAKNDFDALLSGVVSNVEQQLPANYPMFMFPPTTALPAAQHDIEVRAKYYVLTYDENLTLNSPKYYSVVKNDITATLDNDDFTFEPGKQYKIVLNLGLTSAKFDVYVLDDSGEYILLSAVVKEWDLKTVEANVQ